MMMYKRQDEVRTQAEKQRDLHNQEGNNSGGGDKQMQSEGAMHVLLHCFHNHSAHILARPQPALPHRHTHDCIAAAQREARQHQGNGQALPHLRGEQGGSVCQVQM